MITSFFFSFLYITLGFLNLSSFISSATSYIFFQVVFCQHLCLRYFSLSSRVSVSRAIKPFSEPGRPPDWFSQKVRELQTNTTFSLFVFLHITILNSSQSVPQDNIVSLFLSTVPHNTQSCWRPQKHQSQYFNTDKHTNTSVCRIIIICWCCCCCFVFLSPVKYFVSWLEVFVSSCAPGESVVRRVRWWKQSKTSLFAG